MTSRPAELRRWHRLPVLLRDGIPVALTYLVVVQPWLAGAGARIGELPERSQGLLGVLVTAGLWLPLIVRRRWPWLSLALVGAAFAAHELLGYPGTLATIGVYLALYSAGAHQQRGRWVLACAATGGYAGLAVALTVADSPTEPTGLLGFYGFLVVCWAAGSWIRTRQKNEDNRRQLTVEAAMTRERARIARELHDVVTHHVTAMVVQADAAQFVIGDSSPGAVTGLTAISDTGRRALADLRNLLGVLTAADDPQARDTAQRSPAVGRISDLVEQTRLTGQPIELTEDGDPPVAVGGAQVAAYRVVQEALTNALKHAAGQPTGVRIRYRPGVTELEVVTAGPGRPGADPGLPVSGGHGLNGMRERVGVFGGEFQAGPTSDGGFKIQARIPEEKNA